ncbi:MULTISPECIES: ABC transporter substrate-binding protein [Pseudonocardia]|uniref:ABC transporter substrate-binding protein n=2 Tax=Pseudonocardia TaxID=1847 RepID=A0ABQ0S531_9PSEU|nr:MULTISPECIES: ABC transporter substrate-binding protein [Pseudonocardia]OSY36438.1 putative ABC transporter substrate-binding lipoprotein YhfQ precursor [Pseudonocardia autotrophica]TDN74730.1 iron complex transport system substrate-binding protein [Pseudonocardia autotrophica]BBG05505.1 ABC transporter substrate-binding protein [Pseudonocardia autotrophica]GEC28030.1 ABC transporter substrate-binding protein [Pseudonocardia saturnea]
MSAPSVSSRVPLSHEIHDDLNRRHFVGAGLLTVLLAGCGAPVTTSGRPGAGDPWEFTDDAGTRIALPAHPRRITVDSFVCGALWDYGIRPIAVWGRTTAPGGTVHRDLGDADLSTMDDLTGEAITEVNLERLAAVAPEIIVTFAYDGSPGWTAESQFDLIRGIAPVASVDIGNRPVRDIFAGFARIAEALGGEPSAEAIGTARAGFDAACERLRVAAAQRPGLRLLAGDLDLVQGTGLWVNTPDWPLYALLTELGVELVNAGFAEPSFVSEELLTEQRADAILLINSNVDPAASYDSPVWQSLPAVRAGQFAWPDQPPVLYSYDNYARLLDRITELLTASRRLDPQ